MRGGFKGEERLQINWYVQSERERRTVDDPGIHKESWPGKFNTHRTYRRNTVSYTNEFFL